MDKAGREYWNDSWSSTAMPASVDPGDTRPGNHVNRQFHRVFRGLFIAPEARSRRLVEIGCANSAWLPYFAKEFGFKVSGMDYSPNGCEMARRVLQANGIAAEVICADLFAPPENFIGAFDVAVSFGLAEHFDDTTACLRAIATLLKPGGVLVTSIPNMAGWVGSLQKTLNRPVFDIHRSIDRAGLKDAHELAGLDVIECDYLVATHFGVVNLSGIAANSMTGFLKKALLAVLTRISLLAWHIEHRVGRFPAGRRASPYVYCIARKREITAARDPGARAVSPEP